VFGSTARRSTAIEGGHVDAHRGVGVARERRRVRGAQRGDLGWQTSMLQDALEALPLTRGYEEASMQVEAVVAHVTAPEAPRLGCRRRVSTSADARARPAVECDPTLHGRRGDPEQYRRILRPRVLRTIPLVGGSQPLPFEEAPDVRRDGGQHLVDVRRVETRAGMEAHTHGTPGKHAVEDQCMNMYIEI